MVEEKTTKLRLLWEGLFFLVLFILLMLVFNPVIFVGGDNAYYMALSHSIMEDFSYNTHWQPGTPPEVAIPPGYPMLLVIIQMIFGDSLIPMKMLSVLSFLLAMIFIYKLLRLYEVDTLIAGGTVLFMTLSPVIHEYSHWILTEAPFMAVSAIGLCVLEKYIQSDNESKKGLILSAIILAFAVYIRIPALTIIPAAFCYLWLRKGLKQALIFLSIVFVLMLPWALRVLTAQTPDGGNIYIEGITQRRMGTGEDTSIGIVGFLNRIPNNFRTYFFDRIAGIFVPQLFGVAATIVDQIIGGFILSLLGLGMFFSIKTKHYFPSLFILFTFGLLFLNHSVRIRYIIILVPYIMHAFIKAFEFLFQTVDEVKVRNFSDKGLFFKIISYPLYTKEDIGSWATGFLILTLIVLSAVDYHEELKFNLRVLYLYSLGDEYAGLHPAYYRYFETAEWIRDNTSKDATVVARKPRLFYWKSGRRSDMYLRNNDPDVVIEDILERGFDYIILDRVRAETGHYLVPAIREYIEYFHEVHRTEEPVTYILKVRKDGR